MGFTNKNKVRSFFKGSFFYVVYSLTAFTACALAFILVLSFLNPAVSEETAEQTAQKRPAVKEIFGVIFRNLKTLFKESFSESPDQAPVTPPPPANLEGPREIEIPKEDLRPPDNLEQKAPPAEELSPENNTGSGSALLGEPVSPNPSEPTEEELGGYPEQPAPEDQPVPEGLADGGQGQPAPGPAEQPAPVEQGAQSPEQMEQRPPEFQEAPSEASLEVQSYMVPFIYDSIHLRDPFEDPTVKEEKGVVIIPKTPPEEHDLKEIKLRGIIWDTENPKALFELPGDAGYYSLIRGDKIGKNGVIFEIRESEVVIVETNYIGSGEQKKAEQTVKIKKIDRVGLKNN